MRHQRQLALATWLLALVTALPSTSYADNPIVQTNYTADPAPMVHEGRLYLYTSHDEDNTVSNFYTMNDWRLYSTVDMVNWTDHGTPAAGKTFSWFTDNAWAPQGISRNGKFYLYLPINNNTGAKIGVAVANSPAGPFSDPLGKGLAAQGNGNIDPTVFIDEDGQAYMYWGNASLRYVKLNSDMTSYSGSVNTVSLNGFLEGPWFYKRGSLYYMVYAANGTSTEKISYATSNSPTGPWTVRGDVMDSGKTYTNHPGVVDFKGHSYFFYHNSALPGGNDFRRSVCVEEFTYGTDGSIPKLTMSTKGPNGIATLNPFQQVEAETIAFSAGLKTEVCSDTGGGMNVSSISNGDYIKVKDVDFADGVTSFDARVSNSGSNAKIELHLDSQTGTSLGTCDVSGASSWTTKTCMVTGGSGKHDLFLKFTGGSGDLFKFNWWKFTGPTMPNNGTGGTGGVGGTGGAGQGGVAGQGSGGVSGGGGTSTAGGGNASGGAGGMTASGGSTAGGAAGNGQGGTGTAASGAANGGSVSAGSGGTLAMMGGSSNGAKGGATPSGGTASSSGGSAGNPQVTGGLSSTGPGAAPPVDSSGCSCRVGADQRQAGPWATLGLLGTVLLSRKRSAARKRARST
ncbi:MAG TPA: glycoside hydrolase family 43 protein [Polyangiaceae bacterium]|nr:glycoside hydrolase family 43 protein [Polyangiaceae bacterium]